MSKIDTIRPQIEADFRLDEFCAPRGGMKLDLLADFARSHHGLVTLDAFVASGHAKRAWYRAIDAGLISPVFPGVGRVVTSPTSRLQTIHAAVLAVGAGAVASHRTAAELYGVPRPPGEPIDVLTVRERRPRGFDGVEIHRPRDLIDIAPSHRHRIPVSKAMRWLVDLGAVDRRSVHSAVGHVLTNRLASGADLLWAATAHSRQGRHGIVAFRRALGNWMVGSESLDSELERVMSNLQRRYALPPMTFHAICAGYEVDFLVDGTPVVIECDSLRFHDQRREDFERDRRKKAELAAAGYRVVPVTYLQLTREPRWAVAIIRRAVKPYLP